MPEALLAVAIFLGIMGVGLLVYALSSDYGYNCGADDTTDFYEKINK